METFAIIIGCMTGTAAFWALFRLFFADADEFGECIRYWLTPDIFSWFNGEGFEDMWAEMKLGMWFACGFGAAYAGYVAVMAFGT